MEWKKAFGKAIKDIRKNKKLTQRQCADGLRVTQAQWSAYETGKSGATLDAIADIAIVLDVKPLTLLKKFFENYQPDKDTVVSAKFFQYKKQD